MSEHLEPVPKGSGHGARSLDLIRGDVRRAEAAQPITGRGIGYKLFTAGLILQWRAQKCSACTAAKEAREGATSRGSGSPTRPAPWSGRHLGRSAEYARCVAQSYRRDFWNQQPHRVQVWSEKGTVRGVLGPVLDRYAVGFLPVHGFSSATAAHDIAEDDDGRPLVILYVGDFDPSGLYMSEEDLPARFDRYNGDHITLKRIALTTKQLTGRHRSRNEIAQDPRCKWFLRQLGGRCWELDAMDPNDSRCVERAIKS
jgi:hypothetical protein